MATDNRYTFQKIAKGSPFDKNEISSDKSREWFRNTAMNVKKMSAPEFQKNASAFQNVENLSLNSLGKMYCFSYDPKHKLTLPYYDVFPLIFPIKFESDRMLGINMHYLPPGYRARLMDALYTTISNDKYNKTTKLQINYEILRSASQFKYFKPCVKMYLFDHVISPFMYIQPEAWDYTLLLPLDRFKKKSRDFVWLQSQLKL
jgi:hypothetical protein